MELKNSNLWQAVKIDLMHLVFPQQTLKYFRITHNLA